MEPAHTPTTIVTFTRRHRWRWWAMIVVGTLFMGYGLALLSSPAWAYRGLFGVEGFWLWLRGEIYLIFGFLQTLVGIGHIRLTSRPTEAVIADPHGITVRRLFSKQRLAWDEITEVRKGRSSLLLAATPISLWKLFLCDPRLLRLDATVMDASVEDMMALIARRGTPSTA